MQIKIVSMRRKRVTNHFQHLCDNHSGKPQEVWNSLRPFKQNAPNGHLILKGKNHIIQDQNEVGETLDEHFANVAKDLSTGAHKHFTDQSHVSQTSR